jgi:hypothetical protein
MSISLRCLHFGRACEEPVMVVQRVFVAGGGCARKNDGPARDSFHVPRTVC